MNIQHSKTEDSTRALPRAADLESCTVMSVLSNSRISRILPEVRKQNTSRANQKRDLFVTLESSNLEVCGYEISTGNIG